MMWNARATADGEKARKKPRERERERNAHVHSPWTILPIQTERINCGGSVVEVADLLFDRHARDHVIDTLHDAHRRVAPLLRLVSGEI